MQAVLTFPSLGMGDRHIAQSSFSIEEESVISGNGLSKLDRVVLHSRHSFRKLFQFFIVKRNGGFGGGTPRIVINNNEVYK